MQAAAVARLNGPTAGLTLAASRTEETLKVYLVEKVTPQPATAIKEHKAAITRIMRENEAVRRTGTTQSEHQVFELAREHFGLDGREG